MSCSIMAIAEVFWSLDSRRLDDATHVVHHWWPGLPLDVLGDDSASGRHGLGDVSRHPKVSLRSLFVQQQQQDQPGSHEVRLFTLGDRMRRTACLHRSDAVRSRPEPFLDACDHAFERFFRRLWQISGRWIRRSWREMVPYPGERPWCRRRVWLPVSAGDDDSHGGLVDAIASGPVHAGGNPSLRPSLTIFGPGRSRWWCRLPGSVAGPRQTSFTSRARSRTGSSPDFPLATETSW